MVVLTSKIFGLRRELLKSNMFLILLDSLSIQGPPAIKGYQRGLGLVVTPAEGPVFIKTCVYCRIDVRSDVGRVW